MLKKAYRSIHWFIIVSFFVISVSQAHSEPGKHFLWKLSSQGNTVYLLGSLHIFKQEFYPLAPVIEAAFRNSDTIVFEADTDRMNAPAVQSILVSKGLYPPGESLKKNISGDTYHRLQTLAGKSNLSMDVLNRMKPWLCALSITTQTLSLNGFDPAQGIDAHFLKKAKQNNKKILFLETPEFQLNLFSSITDRMEEAMLSQSMDELGIVVKLSSEIISAWQNGRTKQMETLIVDSMKDYPKLYDAFFIKRNQNWVAIIEALLKKRKNTLVVVGSGHLVGKSNVRELMKAKGYSIVQK